MGSKLVTPAKQRRELHVIEQAFPRFACVPGCTDCCGPVIFAPAERERLTEEERRRLDDVHQQQSADGRVDCPFIVPGQGCGIYARRPLVCRAYGTIDTPAMRCPHGRRPDHLFREEEGHRLMARYVARLGGLQLSEDLQRVLAAVMISMSREWGRRRTPGRDLVIRGQRYEYVPPDLKWPCQSTAGFVGIRAPLQDPARPWSPNTEWRISLLFCLSPFLVASPRGGFVFSLVSL